MAVALTDTKVRNAKPAEKPRIVELADRIASYFVAALLFVAVGPSLVAYRAWGAGVARVGPTTAGFFSNLTPLFAALMSATLLGEPPHLYHAAGFVLIVGGILVSSRR